MFIRVRVVWLHLDFMSFKVFSTLSNSVPVAVSWVLLHNDLV